MSAAKKNRLLLVLIAGVTIAAVFFALNESFAWLSFFKMGQGQKFEAGYIDVSFTPSYAQYWENSQWVSANGKYTYLPGHDLCEGPRTGDTKLFQRLGFGLNFGYDIQSACVVRFNVEYQNTYYDDGEEEYVTTGLKPAYDMDYTNYTAPELTAKGKAMVHVRLDNATYGQRFVYDKLDGDAAHYWYYGAYSAIAGEPVASDPQNLFIVSTVLPSGTGSIQKIFSQYTDISNVANQYSKLQLVGANIGYEGEDSGKITIKITAQIRQHEAGIVTWTNYKEAQFVL